MVDEPALTMLETPVPAMIVATVRSELAQLLIEAVAVEASV